MALALVGLGAIIMAAGPDGVLRMAQFVWSNAGFLLVAVAVLAVLATVVPRGALAGPLLIAVAGVGVLAMRDGWSREIGWAAAGAGMVFAGAWLVRTAPAAPRDGLDPVWRAGTAFFPGAVLARPGEQAPHELTATVVATRLVIDLRAARANDKGRIELTLSCWAGRMDVYLPGRWAVIAGRLHAARGVRFTGGLDRAELVPYPARDEFAEVLAQAVRGRARRYGEEDGSTLDSMVVIVHLLGAIGDVNLVGRD